MAGAAGRVVVVGLGPCGVDLLAPAARDALLRAPVRCTRTAQHPAVAELRAEGIDLPALDHHYERAATLEEAYRGIVDELVALAGAHGEVAYAVPGSPGVAEGTVGALRATTVEVVVVPGVSFADLAWPAVGFDPLGGATIVDGHDLPAAVSGRHGALLVAQCDSPRVLSDLKLTLLDVLPPEQPVTVLARLGSPDEEVRTLPLADLDRAVAPDHLTSVFVDTGRVLGGGTIGGFVALAERLRGPGGCPWDAAQTHHSLARHTLEEAYEVVEAIGRLPLDAPGGEPGDPADWDALADELGDLLFQVVIHATLAAEAGTFTFDDVVAGIHAKLTRRHPHVFGDDAAIGADEVVANWERIKRDERASTSLVDGITAGLPALLLAPKLLRKAESVGLAAVDLVAASATVAELRTELATAGEGAAEEAGELLAAAVVACRDAGVDAEGALAAWADRFRARFRTVEALAVRRGVDLHAAAPGVVGALWTASAPERPGPVA